MKEIAVMSGKGGTGKTSILAALGAAASANAVIADCDVDASNTHLLYKPEIVQKENFRSNKTAVIDYSNCLNCGLCIQLCRFDAIKFVDEVVEISEIDCEGCSLCSHKCPGNAISMEMQKTGEWYLSKSRFNNWFVFAELSIGGENSGKLVNKVKTEARATAEKHDCNYLLIDGPPGIGCPAISTVSGTDEVLIITEATKSGVHDLQRLIELIRHFKISASCIINKYDLNPNASEEIEQRCIGNGIPVLSKIPFTSSFTNALEQGKTLYEYEDDLLKEEINKIWNKIK